MNSSLNNDHTQNNYAAFIAIDWADQKHTFSLQVAGQAKKETGTLEQKPEIIGPWVAKLRERFGGRPIAVAVEQSRGALIHALLAYDFLVLYPIHPTTVAKFREAFKFSGAKSDPLDTDQILEILTKHLELLKPLNPDTQVAPGGGFAEEMAHLGVLPAGQAQHDQALLLWAQHS